MSNFLENLNTVKANVDNNRKNILSQIEQLEVQITSAKKTIEEMDTLATALSYMLESPAVLESAEVHVAAAQVEDAPAVTDPLTAAA